MDASLRLLRVIQAALLGSVVLYAVVGEVTGPKESRDVKQTQLILIVLSATEVGIILLVRRRMVQPLEETLRSQPEDAAALSRWRAGNIVTFALAEAVGLYGVALRFLGATLLQVIPFYASAAVLMLVFTPRRPE